MDCNRREFIKVTGTGVLGLSLLQLGVDITPVQAYTATLKTTGTKEIVTVCPFCSVSCHIVASVRNGKLISTEGDPEYPINEGALCAKGAALFTMTLDNRLQKPMYRAAGATRWVEKSWEWTLEQIADRVKKVRDKDLILKNDKGQTVNRLESMFFIGTSHADNEECAIAHQMSRGLGIVHIDHQART